VPAANVTAANVIASTALPVLTQQQVTSASVDVSNVSDASVASVVVRAGARADRPCVHTVTDQAYDSEVSAYFHDSDGVPPPSAFHYVSPSPPRATSPLASVRVDRRQSQAVSWVDNVRSAAASQRQLRAPSRQSVMSARSHASGRQSTHSQVADPFVELMRGVFDSQRADAAAQAAAAQRADLDRELARRDAEFARREKDAVDKA